MSISTAAPSQDERRATRSLELARAANQRHLGGPRVGPGMLGNHAGRSLGAAGIGGSGARAATLGGVTIALYMAFGAVFYAVILPEQFTLVDALYFSMTTFTTVGYGDITPKTQSGRAFTSLYALFGVAVIGHLVSYFGEKVAEKSAASEKEAAEQNDDKLVALLSQGKSHRPSLHPHIQRQPSFFKRNARADKEADVLKLAKRNSLTFPNFMRDNWAFFPLVVVFVVGSFVEMNLDQGGTFIDVMYYTVATLTTIGYGDLVPDDQFTRGVATVLVPLSTISMATLIGRFAEFQLRKKEVLRQAKKWEKGFDKEDLKKMDEDGDGKVSKKEFVYFMLISSDKATQGYLDRLEALFDELDDDDSGYLDEDDFLTHIDRSNEKLSREVGDSEPSREVEETNFKVQSRRNTAVTCEDEEDTGSLAESVAYLFCL